MITKDNAAVLIGMAAIVATLGIGTCSTNSRIDDGFTNVYRQLDNVHRRIDDTNQRIDDTNQRMNEGFTSINRRIDEVQADIREIRSMLFEVLKDVNPAN